MIKNKIDEKYITHQNYQIEVIEYKNSKNVTVIFNDERKTVLKGVQYITAVRGTISNPYHPTIFKVGYIGIGNYSRSSSPILYSKWHSILRRCYSKYFNKIQNNYITCTISEEWKCLQNFGKWFEENYNPIYMEGWELDKDILKKGNKLYSPETCCFVPQEINKVFTKNNIRRGDYPIGVSFKKENKKFSSSITINSKSKHIGYFDTIEEAFYAYKKVKEQYIKDIANKWKGQITEACYEALMNYKVEITD